MPDADIQQMIDDCNSVRDIDKAHGGPGFSDWEKGFLESVEAQYESKGRLTDRQQEILWTMWNRI